MTEISDDSSVVEPIFEELRINIPLNICRDIKFRKQALKSLVDGYEAMKEEISEALKKDLGQN